MISPKTYQSGSSNLLFANWPFQPGVSQPAELHIPIEQIIQKCNITTDPVLCFQGNGIIHDLIGIHHSDDELKYLKNRIVHVFLFEPMCCYLLDDPDQLYPSLPFNCGFYSEFNTGTESRHRSVELDSVQQYAQQNQVNVTVHTGDYGVEQYSKYYPNIKLICDDIFLKNLTVYTDATQVNKQIDTKFISTNWRYTTGRAAVSACMSQYDCNLVWGYHVAPEIVLDKSVWLPGASQQLREQIALGLTDLNAQQPRWLDIPIKEATVIEENNCSQYPESAQLNYHNPVGLNNITCSLKSFYDRSFLDVVTESRYAQPTANLSEKVFQAIQYKTPFLLVAPPHSLQYLRDLGLKTFSQWWDESYDVETDHAKRLEKIMDVVQQISEMSLADINTMYTEMQDLLEENLHHYITQLTTAGKLTDRNTADASLVQWT